MSILRRILRALGWGAAGLLITAFLVGYLAPYLSPLRFWWTDLFAVGVPALSVVVVSISVGLGAWGWSRRRWGRLVVSAVLLILVVVRFGTRIVAWIPGGTTDHDTSQLRVMTLNVPTSVARTHSSTPLSTLIRRESPDILALQELTLQTRDAPPLRIGRVSTPLQALLDGSGAYTIPTGLPRGATIQQPVIGRVTLDSTSIHPLPPNGESSARSRYTRTEFTWRGRSAVLYNVHLHSVGKARPWTMVPEKWTSLSRWKTFLRTYREGTLRRAQQARLIRRQITRESRPVLVVGDFNSTPHQWAYRHIAEGLQSAVHRRIRGWGNTFPARRPLVQIDHVLADPAWQITAARIPRPKFPEAVSDHRPVVAQLRWKTE